MFDWHEEDGVTHTIWSDFEERENNIVPYPKSSDGTLNMQGNDQKNTGVIRSTEQSTASSKNEIPGCNMDSCSRYYLDSWSNFPSSVDNAIGKWSSGGNDHVSTSSTTMVDDFTDALSTGHANSTFKELCQSTDILDGSNKSSYKEPFDFPFYDEEVDGFLDCDWDSIAHFDDLDGIFRDGGSIFGNEMALDVEELLSPADSTNTSAPSFSIHETSINRNVSVPTEKGPSTFQEMGKSQGKRTISKDDVDKMDGEKTVGRKIEEKRAMTKSQNLPNMYNDHVQQFAKYDDGVPASLQSFQPPVFSQQCQVAHQPFTGYGDYPVFPFPSQVYNAYPQYQASNLNYPQNPDATSKMPKMTPQEKIEKLRWRQKMQKIEEHEKHSAKQVSNQQKNKMLQMNQNNCSVLGSIGKTEECAKDGYPSELNMGVKKEELHVSSVASNDYALQEKLLHEFQETIRKLDDNLRLCMKESLNRLARNVMERQCGNNNDRSSANISRGIENGIFKNETRIFEDRLSAATDVETNTNPIDRIVAHLLFHTTARASNPKEEMSLSSSVLQNLGAKHSTWHEGGTQLRDTVKIT